MRCVNGVEQDYCYLFGGWGGANVGAIGGGDNVQHNNFVLHGALLKEIMIMLHCTMEQYNTYVV